MKDLKGCWYQVMDSRWRWIQSLNLHPVCNKQVYIIIIIIIVRVLYLFIYLFLFLFLCVI